VHKKKISPSHYSEFFRKATGYHPYPYQQVLADVPLKSMVLNIPTAAGKTAAVVLSWLWRMEIDPASTPRRLVYCLPMHTLVEQTRDRVREWLDKLALDVNVYTLMGGEVEEGWELYPERPAILVGTQDILLSRALNRGYAMSPSRWAISFGLLNNDCAWVLDETQLMSSGLYTSAQLHAMRGIFGVYAQTVSIWMSATMEAIKLRTVDFGLRADGLPRVTLSDSDRKDSALALRLNAKKRLLPAPDTCRLPAGLAEFVAGQHARGTQTLVVVNRVERAREVFEAVERRFHAKAGPELLLAHSQFRPYERHVIEARLKAPLEDAGRIIVATQVVEAGIDITSALLVTDVAPWASMVQRFGRCNRGGEYATAKVYWVDRPLLSKQEKLAMGELHERDRTGIAMPYSWEELWAASQILAIQDSAAAPDLPVGPETPGHGHVIRRRDLLDLFDTSQDLSGLQTDVSRFVRDADDHDVFLAWRPTDSTTELLRDELCPVSIGSLKEFLKRTKSRAFVWDVLEGGWVALGSPERMLRPGLRIILDVSAGGYDVRYGWSPWSKRPVEPIASAAACEPDSMSDDRNTAGAKKTLMEHTTDVLEVARAVIAALDGVGLGDAAEHLISATLYHDLGKAHPIFQATLRDGDAEGPPLAKSPSLRRHARPFFRHELASALAMLDLGVSDLAAYLVAAHHGKVRMTIRSLPGEVRPPEPDRLFARGIFDGEELPPVELPGVSTPRIRLKLEPMVLGASSEESPSWVERILGLRDTLGPFRLAYLEAVMRAVDRRASSVEVEA
jgi:CRISPR-associated endonuclease/helicase Cas3